LHVLHPGADAGGAAPGFAGAEAPIPSALFSSLGRRSREGYSPEWCRPAGARDLARSGFNLGSQYLSL